MQMDINVNAIKWSYNEENKYQRFLISRICEYIGSVVLRSCSSSNVIICFLVNLGYFIFSERANLVLGTIQNIRRDLCYVETAVGARRIQWDSGL